MTAELPLANTNSIVLVCGFVVIAIILKLEMSDNKM